MHCFMKWCMLGGHFVGIWQKIQKWYICWVIYSTWKIADSLQCHFNVWIMYARTNVWIEWDSVITSLELTLNKILFFCRMDNIACVDYFISFYSKWNTFHKFPRKRWFSREVNFVGSQWLYIWICYNLNYILVLWNKQNRILGMT